MKKYIIIILIIILAGFVFAFNYWSGQQKTGEQREELFEEELEGTISIPMASEIIQNLPIISGEVTLINGRELTIAAKNDVSIVFIKEDAEIKLFGTVEEIIEGVNMVKPNLTKAKFEDIKLGNKVQIITESDQQGIIFGKTITIIP